MFYKLRWFLQTIVIRFFLKKVGYNSYIATPTFIRGGKGIVVGRRVRIFPGVRMETYKKGIIKIEDNVAIQQNVHITCSTNDLIIGSNSTILGNVFITNIDHDYQEIGVHILEQRHILKQTIIGQNCFVGYGAAIQAGTILGKQCVVGANAVVRGTFPDYCVLVGAPAKVVKRYDMATGKWLKTDAKGNFIL
jgi:acetyltransferase-like isoleucine patch superfamily enzyme